MGSKRISRHQAGGTNRTVTLVHRHLPPRHGWLGDKRRDEICAETLGRLQSVPPRRADRARQQLRRTCHPTSDSSEENALFAGHQLGAENWATIASLVETCKMLDLEPYAYLSDVLARIISRSDTDPIDDLLPYNWVNTNAGQTMFEMSNIVTAA